MQIYSKETSEVQIKPKEKTVQFLIDFSKSLTFVKTKSEDFIELNLN